jgi:hypothetical protein
MAESVNGGPGGFLSLPAQRTAVKLRPHQETTRSTAAMTEPVVHHHGREAGRCRLRRGAALSFNSLLGGAPLLSALMQTQVDEVVEIKKRPRTAVDRSHDAMFL